MPYPILMTHPIGTSTCNITINVPKDERDILGRAAFAAGSKSVGDFLRVLILAGLETKDHASAERLRQVRREYYGTVMLVIFCGALMCGERFELRRARTRIEERMEEAA